jgi:hypothetical protein
MVNEKEAKELDQVFEAVLDELFALKTSTSISSEKLFKRIATLQKKAKNVCLTLHGEVKTESGRLEMEPVLPKADIDGLCFNEQKVQACFEKGDDGWYYSEDVLFMSARNVKDDNSRDVLLEYLNTIEICARFATAFGVSPEDIEVALPQEVSGVKKYHGVACRYWLADSASDAFFYSVGSGGYTNPGNASWVVGYAPAFRVKGTRLIEEVKA